MSKLSYQETFQKLRQAYVERLKNSVIAIDNVLAQKQLGPLSSEDIRRAISLFHGLAGTGTTFGFPQVSESALRLEVFLDLVLGSLSEYDVMTDRDFQTLEAMALELRKICLRSAEITDVKNITASDSATNIPVEGVYSVLIVDDDDHLCELLTLKLKEQGISVESVRNGDTALKILGLKRPDLLILDIMMPGMSGHELLRSLKQNPEFLSIPVIMLTGKSADKDVTHAIHSGAMDYIVKPFDPDALIKKVNDILESVRRTVLIVDNDPFIVQLLENKYKYQGYKIMTADNGVRAWNIIYRDKPDIVILDIIMPGMDGLAVLKNMQEDENTKNIPVIVVSTRVEKEQIQEAMDAGANEYVPKPFISDDLIEITRRLLKKPATGA